MFSSKTANADERSWFDSTEAMLEVGQSMGAWTYSASGTWV
ncbi:hypothetical protein [Xanthomonas phage XPV2]|nr:hypothetical protein [Xanthomonas phage XPV2]